MILQLIYTTIASIFVMCAIVERVDMYVVMQGFVCIESATTDAFSSVFSPADGRKSNRSFVSRSVVAIELAHHIRVFCILQLELIEPLSQSK